MEEISNKGGHFVTLTENGLEILSEGGGERTVIDDIQVMRSLYGAVQDWIRDNQCYYSMVVYGPSGETQRVRCELRRTHDDAYHYGRRLDSTKAIVVGHVYWTENGEAPTNYTEFT